MPAPNRPAIYELQSIAIRAIHVEAWRDILALISEKEDKGPGVPLNLGSSPYRWPFLPGLRDTELHFQPIFSCGTWNSCPWHRIYPIMPTTAAWHLV